MAKNLPDRRPTPRPGQTYLDRSPRSGLLPEGNPHAAEKSSHHPHRRLLAGWSRGVLLVSIASRSEDAGGSAQAPTVHSAAWVTGLRVGARHYRPTSTAAKLSQSSLRPTTDQGRVPTVKRLVATAAAATHGACGTGGSAGGVLANTKLQQRAGTSQAKPSRGHGQRTASLHPARPGERSRLLAELRLPFLPDCGAGPAGHVGGPALLITCRSDHAGRLESWRTGRPDQPAAGDSGGRPGRGMRRPRVTTVRSRSRSRSWTLRRARSQPQPGSGADDPGRSPT